MYDVWHCEAINTSDNTSSSASWTSPSPSLLYLCVFSSVVTCRVVTLQRVVNGIDKVCSFARRVRGSPLVVLIYCGELTSASVASQRIGMVS